MNSLGKCYKKRIARQAQGKRGSYRVLIAYKQQERLIFCMVFQKGKKLI
ncbi:MAG: type II toxin-antitoxin system RelE/ParE family toxin [Pseudomonadota bacterium]